MELSQVLEKLLDHGLKEEHMFASTVLECMTVYLNTKLYLVADPDRNLGKQNDGNNLSLERDSIEVGCVPEMITKVTDKLRNIQDKRTVTNKTEVIEEKLGLMDEVEDLYGVVSPTQLHVKEEKSEEGEILEDIPIVSKDIKSENKNNIGNKHTSMTSTKKIPTPGVNTTVRTMVPKSARKPEKKNTMKEIRTANTLGSSQKSDFIDDTKCIDIRNETLSGGDLEKAPSGENSFKDSTDGAELLEEEQLHLTKLESKYLDNNQDLKVSQNIHRRRIFRISQADYNCGYCEFSVKNVAISGLYFKSTLRRHRKKIHNVCVICRDKFESPSDLKGHMNFVHNDEKRQIICGIKGCLFGENGEGIGKIFPHVRYKHDKIRYVCEECNQTYTHRSQHLLQHSLPPKVVGETRPICKKCGIELISKKLMFEHYSSVHNQKLSCDSCQYQTQDDTNAVLKLIVHKKIHREGTLICGTCSFETLSRFTMRKHLAREHKQGNLFQCSICGYTAVIQFRLDEHMSRHTSEKLHACDICDFKATVKNDLKRHIHRHQENPKFLCDQCDYKTWDSANFVTHKKVKHGSEIHKCTDCEYETRSLRSLRLHKFKHGPAMKCPQCKFETKSIRALKQHKYKHKL